MATDLTFDFDLLTVEDYVTLATLSELSFVEFAIELMRLAGKACVGDLPDDPLEVLNAFQAAFIEYQSNRDVPLSFWEWGKQDEP